jgi:uncharacterized protein YcgI (DUF1989 family)
VKICAVVTGLFKYSFHNEQEACLQQASASRCQYKKEIKENNRLLSEMSSAFINSTVHTRQLLYTTHDNITLLDRLCTFCDPNSNTPQYATRLLSICRLFKDAVGNSTIGLQRRLAGL